MLKVFSAVFLIFGTIVGSGFASGKEIFVFFSRFGNLSYFFIFLSCFLFFFCFVFFLKYGEKLLRVLEKNKLINNLVLFIGLIFAASMFAGICSLFSYFGSGVYVFLIFVLFGLCLFFAIKGFSGLAKLNFVLMPIVSVVFACVLIYIAISSILPVSNVLTDASLSWVGIFYSPLYVALNSSIGCIVIASMGKGMTKKQTVFASLFSAMLLCFFLCLGNYVLQSNMQFFQSDMPFLALASKNNFLFGIVFLIVFVGCFTTLASLCVTLKNSFDKVFDSKFLSAFMAVVLPFAISTFGFGEIVSYLYPICSVLGIFVLGVLFVLCLKKR